MKKTIFIVIMLLAVALSSGCGGETEENDRQSAGQDTGIDISESDDDVDTEIKDASEDLDDTDIDQSDASNDKVRTLADYRRCQEDTDCPVGLGSCIHEVSLNRPDSDGRQTVPVREIFDELAEGEGICTLVCTTDVASCDSLSMNGNTADAKPHVCQLVTLGEMPYPENAPAFPFDDQLDPVSMTAGQPFGAICRAPFELDNTVSSSFCSSCDSADGCGGGAICWSLLEQALASGGGDSGTCLSACASDDDCALGFACDVESGGKNYCRPVLDTCSDCRDLDGDGFGSGRCGISSDQPVTPYDCDDRNPIIYYNPTNMFHAFPEYCGEHDYNCNGISDAVEQIGAAKFPVEHCTSCYDVCEGVVANGESACRNINTLEDPVPECKAKCEVDVDGDGLPLFADCDGDLSNGCEVEVTDSSRVYYRDLDGDGYGDPDDSTFACTAGEVPEGYVANREDCDDSDPLTYPGAKEYCNGVDNNCNGDIDDNADEEGDECDTGYPGICSTGVFVCHGKEGLKCEALILPGDHEEICNDGLDNNCDGEIDEDNAGDAVAFYPDVDGDGFGDMHAEPVMSCSQPDDYVDNNLDCDDSNSAVYPGAPDYCGDIDYNCNGIFNEKTSVDAIAYYPDTDFDGYGDKFAEATMACSAPAGMVDNNLDCDDKKNAVNPGATEVCNGIDDNCDDQIDEGFLGLGDSCNIGKGQCLASGKKVCNSLGTEVVCNAAVIPPGGETCNGKDDDCNGVVDNGCLASKISETTAKTSGGKIAEGIEFYAGETRTKLNSCNEDAFISGVIVSYHDDSYCVERLSFYCNEMYVEETVKSSGNTYEVKTDPLNRQTESGPSYNMASRYTLSRFECPSGYAVTEMLAHTSTCVDGVKFVCTKVFVERDSGVSATVSLSSGDTVTSRLYGSRYNNNNPESSKCATGVASAIESTAGNYKRSGGGGRKSTIGHLEMKCTQPKATYK